MRYLCVWIICLALASTTTMGCASPAAQQGEPATETVTQSAAQQADDKTASDPGAEASGKQVAPEDSLPKHPEPTADQALLTVYSKPDGQILVGGKDTGKQTPATVEITVDQVNRVQVRFGDGTISDAKEVTGKAGTRYKVFIKKKTRADAQ